MDWTHPPMGTGALDPERALNKLPHKPSIKSRTKVISRNSVSTTARASQQLKAREGAFVDAEGRKHVALSVQVRSLRAELTKLKLAEATREKMEAPLKHEMKEMKAELRKIETSRKQRKLKSARTQQKLRTL